MERRHVVPVNVTDDTVQNVDVRLQTEPAQVVSGVESAVGYHLVPGVVRPQLERESVHRHQRQVVVSDVLLGRSATTTRHRLYNVAHGKLTNCKIQ